MIVKYEPETSSALRPVSTIHPRSRPVETASLAGVTPVSVVVSRTMSEEPAMRPEHRHAPAGSTSDQDGNVIPFTHRAGRAGVTVERIDTEPMTSNEYRLAITALAALINQWNHCDKEPPHIEENAA